MSLRVDLNMATSKERIWELSKEGGRIVMVTIISAHSDLSFPSGIYDVAQNMWNTPNCAPEALYASRMSNLHNVLMEPARILFKTVSFKWHVYFRK